MLLNMLISKARLQINVWREVSQQRSDIRKLSDHLLDDIGLHRTHADREINRRFWDTQEKYSSSASWHPGNTRRKSQVRVCTLCKSFRYS